MARLCTASKSLSFLLIGCVFYTVYKVKNHVANSGGDIAWVDPYGDAGEDFGAGQNVTEIPTGDEEKRDFLADAQGETNIDDDSPGNEEGDTDTDEDTPGNGESENERSKESEKTEENHEGLLHQDTYEDFAPEDEGIPDVPDEYKPEDDIFFHDLPLYEKKMLKEGKSSSSGSMTEPVSNIKVDVPLKTSIDKQPALKQKGPAIEPKKVTVDEAPKSHVPSSTSKETVKSEIVLSDKIKENKDVAMTSLSKKLEGSKATTKVSELENKNIAKPKESAVTVMSQSNQAQTGQKQIQGVLQSKEGGTNQVPSPSSKEPLPVIKEQQAPSAESVSVKTAQSASSRSTKTEGSASPTSGTSSQSLTPVVSASSKEVVVPAQAAPQDKEPVQTIHQDVQAGKNSASSASIAEPQQRKPKEEPKPQVTSKPTQPDQKPKDDKMVLPEVPKSKDLGSIRDDIPPPDSHASPAQLKALSDWEQEQLDRRNKIKGFCSATYIPGDANHIIGNSGATQTWSGNYMVDNVNEVIFCNLAKTASTYLKLVLANITGNAHFDETQSYARLQTAHRWDFLRKGHITPLNEESPDSIMYKVVNYKKFMFVRDPVERFISAYREKMEEDIRLPGVNELVTQHKDPNYDESVDGLVHNSFEDFTKWFLAYGHTTDNWSHYHKGCIPCFVDYDYIGHVETMDTDLYNIIQHVYGTKAAEAAKKTAPIIKAATKKRLELTHNVAESYLAQLSNSDKDKLYNAYKVDMTLFGYERPKSYR